jgi:hypothetical protein
MNYTIISNNVNQIFHRAVMYGNTDFITLFLTKYRKVLNDNSGEILTTAFVHDNSNLVSILLNSFRYKSEVLKNVLMDVMPYTNHPNNNEYESMIELLYRQIEFYNHVSDTDHIRLILFAHSVGNLQIAHYLQRRWRPNTSLWNNECTLQKHVYNQFPKRRRLE